MIAEDVLFSRVRGVLQNGWVQLPDYPGYRGTGGPGLLLEELLGLKANNSDTPDSGKWEVKFHSGTSLLTLFHKTPGPKNVMHTMVRTFGWPDDHGRTSFRHTIRGESDRGFKVVYEINRIIVSNSLHTDFIPPYWETNELLAAFAYKLRRLIVVHGTKRGGRVKYESARLYWEPQLSGIVQALTSGVMAIDFDARTTDGSGLGLRDHGTKFRINIDDLQHLYGKNKRF
ncbi:MvaI/BcnI family restriction endonuclease [Xylella fastidiosa]|uniref:MvaI/BcnI family restriction endonuclease n=2 Tax=Xylella fastidiosa TaxID=2371 RepID=A0AAW6HQ61_XYLFS|nr:MvaI/BcnI family restriction endonuclease [Xylella fastidiosa]MBS9444701.1 hypothetical protein [Xylella fastidiosa subsp. multiplex]MBS9447208.1 hypothetical protein [Xylella fastidiosa subsp. multiplex]MBS9449330.1 hypothetical protein [Xylella fastidiosa subsp. multiplex]MBS9450721.1 hypothetical protein [Xylella fastidiosa subsp. multiplex]MBS9485548.1 hypothetical protein [Xylella fastidiosa subsp. multiplex]